MHDRITIWNESARDKFFSRLMSENSFEFFSPEFIDKFFSRLMSQVSFEFFSPEFIEALSPE